MTILPSIFRHNCDRRTLKTHSQGWAFGVVQALTVLVIRIGLGFVAPYPAQAAVCYRDTECPGKELCIDRKCQSAPNLEIPCTSDAECDEEGFFDICIDGICQANEVICRRGSDACQVAEIGPYCLCADGSFFGGSGDSTGQASDQEKFTVCTENLIGFCGVVEGSCNADTQPICDKYASWRMEAIQLCEEQGKLEPAECDWASVQTHDEFRAICCRFTAQEPSTLEEYDCLGVLPTSCAAAEETCRECQSTTTLSESDDELMTDDHQSSKAEDDTQSGEAAAKGCSVSQALDHSIIRWSMLLCFTIFALRQRKFRR